MDVYGSYSISPIPEYEPPQEGYEATFSDFRESGEGPIRCGSSRLIRWAITPASYDDCRLDAGGPRERGAYVNPLDAQERAVFLNTIR